MVLIKALELGSNDRSATGVFQMLFSGKTGHPSNVGPFWAVDAPAKTWRTRMIMRLEKICFHSSMVFFFSIKIPHQILKK
jgi:hypothetical protein